MVSMLLEKITDLVPPFCVFLDESLQQCFALLMSRYIKNVRHILSVGLHALMMSLSIINWFPGTYTNLFLMIPHSAILYSVFCLASVQFMRPMSISIICKNVCEVNNVDQNGPCSSQVLFSSEMSHLLTQIFDSRPAPAWTPNNLWHSYCQYMQKALLLREILRPFSWFLTVHQLSTSAS